MHHGRNPKYIDRNHGGTLIIWDRMFGTFQKEEEEVVYGITKPLNTWNPLRAQIDFWKILFSDISKTHSLSDKLKLLVKPPGWFPEDLGGPTPAIEISPATAKKFNTSIPLRLNYYVLIQFAAILGLTSYFLFSFDALSLPIKIFSAILILFSITCIGALLELRRWAYTGEIFRYCISIGYIILITGFIGSQTILLYSLLFLFVIVSAFFLMRMKYVFIN